MPGSTASTFAAESQIIEITAAGYAALTPEEQADETKIYAVIAPE
jgi:hypothetical protein